MTGSLTIVADDLTGAADCGLQAARRGARVVVRLTGPAAAEPAAAADVVAWDLDTRARDAGTAHERTLAVARGLPDDAIVYVKVDSGLRGHIGAAVDAALAASGAHVAIVAPAFPSMGRTTTAGIHRVTSGAASGPAIASDLRDLLRRQTGHAVAHLPLDRLRAEGVEPTLDRLGGPGPSLLACDGERERDLELLVEGVLAYGRRVVWVGSAGLASALAEALVGPVRAPAQGLPAPTGPTLVVAGSIAPEALVQVRAMLAEDDMAAVMVAPALLAGDGARASSETARAADAVAAHLLAGRDVVLHVGADPLRPAGAPETGAVGSRIAEALGAIVLAAAGSAGPGALVLTGGETARSVCDALGIDAIELVGEIEDGVPAGRAAGTDLAIVTKAGAFGGPGSLALARRALRGEAPCRVR